MCSAAECGFHHPLLEAFFFRNVARPVSRHVLCRWRNITFSPRSDAKALASLYELWNALYPKFWRHMNWELLKMLIRSILTGVVGLVNRSRTSSTSSRLYRRVLAPSWSFDTWNFVKRLWFSSRLGFRISLIVICGSTVYSDSVNDWNFRALA